VQLSDVQQHARRELGIEIEPEMCAYLQRRLEAGAAEKVPLIAADAKTGVPLRLNVALKSFADLQS